MVCPQCYSCDINPYNGTGNCAPKTGGACTKTDGTSGVCNNGNCKDCSPGSICTNSAGQEAICDSNGNCPNCKTLCDPVCEYCDEGGVCTQRPATSDNNCLKNDNCGGADCDDECEECKNVTGFGPGCVSKPKGTTCNNGHSYCTVNGPNAGKCPDCTTDFLACGDGQCTRCIDTIDGPECISRDGAQCTNSAGQLAICSPPGSNDFEVSVCPNCGNTPCDSQCQDACIDKGDSKGPHCPNLPFGTSCDYWWFVNGHCSKGECVLF